MKGCKPFFFDRIDRLCRSGGAIFRSKAQKNHFRSLAMQDESLHPAWSVSKTSFFDTLGAFLSEKRPFLMRGLLWSPKLISHAPSENRLDIGIGLDGSNQQRIPDGEIA